MNANILYQIYQTTEANKAADTTIGLAMYKAEHPEVTITYEEDKAIRGFLARHGQKLAKAYPDREAFAAAVAKAEGKDAEDEEKAEEAE